MKIFQLYLNGVLIRQLFWELLSLICWLADFSSCHFVFFLLIIKKRNLFSLKRDTISFKYHSFVCSVRINMVCWLRKVSSYFCLLQTAEEQIMWLKPRFWLRFWSYAIHPCASHTTAWMFLPQQDQNGSSLSLLRAGTRVPTSSGQTRLPTSCITSDAVISSQHLHFFHLMQPKFSGNPLQAKNK